MPQRPRMRRLKTHCAHRHRLRQELNPNRRKPELSHQMWVPQGRGPHGQVHVRGVEIPCTWGPGIARTPDRPHRVLPPNVGAPSFIFFLAKGGRARTQNPQQKAPLIAGLLLTCTTNSWVPPVSLPRPGSSNSNLSLYRVGAVAVGFAPNAVSLVRAALASGVCGCRWISERNS